MARDYMGLVRGLLAKANDAGSTPAESELLMAKAQELMTKWQIDEATAQASGTVAPEELAVRFVFRNEKGKRLVKARRELYFILADLNHCRIVSHGHNGRDGLSIFGHVSDLDMVEALYASMLVQMHATLAAAQSVGVVVGVSGAVSYAHGWVRRVGSRLAAVKATIVESTGTGSALVLIDRTAIVQRKVDATYDKLKSLKLTSSVRDFTAYGAGDRDGRTADLGGRKVGSDSSARSIGDAR